MKKMLIGLLIVQGVIGMEDDIENQRSAIVSQLSAQQMADQISSIITQFNDASKVDDAKFKELVVSYFKKESLEIEERVTPVLKEKLRKSDSQINEILAKDDRMALEALIHRLMTESIEDAFIDQTCRFEELKQLAASRQNKAKYAVISAIVSGVLGVLGTFLGVYFGKS